MKSFLKKNNPFNCREREENTRGNISPAKIFLKTLLILVLACLLRIPYASDHPLTGDEAASYLLASGQAHNYLSRIPKQPAPIENFRRFIRYSSDYSPRDVIAGIKRNDMHPPFYYAAFHHILQYAGDNLLLLRGLSILFSLLSLLFFYRLGAKLFDENTGFFSALFLAASSYGTLCSAMIRAYPLIALISLLSAWQAVSLAKEKDFSRKKISLLAYAATLSLGLYTLYHFVFVFFFQLVFLVFCHFRDKKNLAILGMTAGAALLFYLPWLPCAAHQFGGVQQYGQHYFHGKSSLRSFSDLAVLFNFLSYLPGFRTPPILLALKTLLSGLLLTGAFISLKEKTTRAFLFATLAYFAANLAADRLFGMQTLLIHQLLFFILPVLFLFLSAGIHYLPKRFALRNLFFVFFLGLSAANSVMLCLHPIERDEAKHVLILDAEIEKHRQKDSRILVLVNTAQRRYLFPIVQRIKAPADLMIIRRNDLNPETFRIGGIGDYDFIFLSNEYVDYEKQSFLKPEDVHEIGDLLQIKGFVQEGPAIHTYEPGESSVIVYKNISASASP